MEPDESNEFASLGKWNSTGGNIPLENMKIDAPMVNTYIVVELLE